MKDPATSRILDDSSPSELRPRKLPTQQRARDLVDKILDTTALLLDEVGIDGLTTNLIADRAEIRVSSIYRYFPNKHAILVALWERMIDRWIVELETIMAGVDSTGPLLHVVDALVDVAAKLDRDETGLIPLLRAMRASPELQVVEAKSNRLIAERGAQYIRKFNVTIPDARVDIVARMLVEVVSSALELAISVEGDDRESLLDELKLMLRNYFAAYVEE